MENGAVQNILSITRTFPIDDSAWSGMVGPDMKLNEIKEAVLAGKTVHWKNGAYRVIFDPTRGSVIAGFLIECVLNGDCIGLTWTNGVTMNGEEEDFFVAE